MVLKPIISNPSSKYLDTQMLSYSLRTLIKLLKLLFEGL
jgi:hypothetical protein